MSEGNGVPFIDLVAPHLELEETLVESVRSAIRSAGFIGGPAVEEFERSFAEFCGSKYAIGVASGTDALRFALMAGGIGPGDVVVTAPNTFVATIEAIIQVGATPRFVDVDPDTFNMSAAALADYLANQCVRSAGGAGLTDSRGGGTVKALLPVHLYGQMCDMDAIRDLARRHGLTVFEDACQAHGADYFSGRDGTWRRAGTVGEAAAFSFYPGKNLGACGEAGAVTTDDEALANRTRMIRDHGQNRKYHHQVIGYNGRLDAIQAAMLQVKLPMLAEWNASRREAAARYNGLLAGIEGIRTPVEPPWSRAVYHLYVVLASNRDELQKELAEAGIGTGLHYPVPLHLQEGYRYLGYHPGDFPVAEALARELLSLPMYPQLRDADQEQVAGRIREFQNHAVGEGVNR